MNSLNRNLKDTAKKARRMSVRYQRKINVPTNNNKKKFNLNVVLMKQGKNRSQIREYIYINHNIEGLIII
jgi:hypothetical protein